MKGGENMNNMALNFMFSSGVKKSSSNDSYSKKSNYSNDSFQNILDKHENSYNKINSSHDKRQSSYQSRKVDSLSQDSQYKKETLRSDSDKGEFHKTVDNTKNDTTDYRKVTEEVRESDTDENMDKPVDDVVEQIKDIYEGIIDLINLLNQQDNLNSSLPVDYQEMNGDLKAILAQLQNMDESINIEQFKSIIQNLEHLLNDLSSKDEITNLQSNQGEAFTSILKELSNTLDESKKIIKGLHNNSSNYNNSEATEVNYEEQIAAIREESSLMNSNEEGNKNLDSNEKSVIAEGKVAAKNDNGDSKIFFQQEFDGKTNLKSFTEVHNQVRNTSSKLFNIDKNDLLNQIVSKVKVDVSSKSTQIQIKLKPETLGEMSVKLSMDDGIITAKAVVQDHQVKQLIESNMAQLKDSLEKQGISIAGFEVSVGDDSNFQRQFGNSWSNKKRKIDRIGRLNNEYDQLLEETELSQLKNSEEILAGRSTISLKA